MFDDVKQEAVKLTPPATIATTNILGVPLSDWVYITTIIYTLILIAIKLKELWKGRDNNG